MNLVKKILIVHDDPKARRRLVLLLADAGFDVRAFATADSAEESARVEWFDLAVIDHELPGAPGLGFVDRLKKIQPTVPVLLLVPELALPVVVQGIRLGVTDVFAAREDPHLLLRRVRALLQLDLPVAGQPDVTPEELAEVESILGNMPDEGATSANPFGMHTQEPSAELLRLSKEKALLEARVERLQHEKNAVEVELKTLLAQSVDEERLAAELVRLQNERELASTAQTAIDEKARGLREMRATIASERQVLEEERRRLATMAPMGLPEAQSVDERAELGAWRQRLEALENELAEETARLQQETRQMAHERRQWHEDLSLLRAQEENLRSYEERLRQTQAKLEADRVLWSSTSSSAAPSRSADEPALREAWSKFQRAAELLEADRNNFRDDRLALNDYQAAIKRREEEVRDREIRFALQEKKLHALPPAPAPASAMKNLTRAPFDLARVVFGSAKKA